MPDWNMDVKQTLNDSDDLIRILSTIVKTTQVKLNN